VDVETILAGDYFRINIYFKALDSIIVNKNYNFLFLGNLKLLQYDWMYNFFLAVGVYELIKLNYDGSTQFIDHYIILNLNIL